MEILENGTGRGDGSAGNNEDGEERREKEKTDGLG